MPHPNARLTTEQRFEMKVDRTGECHRWTGAHVSKGYGSFWYGDRVRSAHIAALMLAGIEIPDGMTVDHVAARGCRHRDCVRIEHLEVVPLRENVRRSNNPAGINARKTECIRGHEFTAANTIESKAGRACRTCVYASAREGYRRRQDAARASV